MGSPWKQRRETWSVIHELLWDLPGETKKCMTTSSNWSAHIFQKPYAEKPEVVIIIFFV